MSEMVERVAKAIVEEHEHACLACDSGMCSAFARAAIEAMRKPTDAMIDQMQADSHGRSRDEIVDIWERGLLEALR